MSIARKLFIGKQQKQVRNQQSFFQTFIKIQYQLKANYWLFVKYSQLQKYLESSKIRSKRVKERFQKLMIRKELIFLQILFSFKTHSQLIIEKNRQKILNSYEQLSGVNRLIQLPLKRNHKTQKEGKQIKKCQNRQMINKIYVSPLNGLIQSNYSLNMIILYSFILQ
ncbi:hypothetical protein pb186bvf_018535 [Paramecium bursaria]